MANSTERVPAASARVRPPECLRVLLDRFDPSVIDLVPDRARIRVVFADEEAWDVIADGEGARATPLRPVLDRFVTTERVDRHDAPPLVASVYHLLSRGEADAYTEAVERAASALHDVRITVSGPWAPYAFAPDALE